MHFQNRFSEQCYKQNKNLLTEHENSSKTYPYFNPSVGAPPGKKSLIGRHLTDMHQVMVLKKMYIKYKQQKNDFIKETCELPFCYEMNAFIFVS